MIAFRRKIYLSCLKLCFLKGKYVRIGSGKKLRKAFAHAGAKPVDIPRD